MIAEQNTGLSDELAAPVHSRGFFIALLIH